MHETTPTQPETSPNQRTQRMGGARIALIVTGALASLLAIGLLGLGGLALWGDGQKDENGYLATDSELFETNARALASERIDLDFDGAEALFDTTDLGDVRLEVAPEGDKPLFVGIARTEDVSSYLRGVAHTTVTDVEAFPFEADHATQPGSAKPAPPAAERIWAAHSKGDGTQTLTWHAEEGDWSVVVMNADGSAGVEADVSAGAKIPYLSEFGWSALGSGTLVAIIAGALVLIGVRPPRDRPGAPLPAGLAPAAG